jgi:hypothetical protein
MLRLKVESGMSKQAADKLAHGALNVVWEKLETLDFLGTDTQASPGPLGFSGAKIKWVDQPQADNPFEIIHISRHQFPIIFQRVTARIESARLIFRCWRSAIAFLAAYLRWE